MNALPNRDANVGIGPLGGGARLAAHEVAQRAEADRLYAGSVEARLQAPVGAQNAVVDSDRRFREVIAAELGTVVDTVKHQFADAGSRLREMVLEDLAHHHPAPGEGEAVRKHDAELCCSCASVEAHGPVA